jgi:hypothetical protein
MSSSLVLLRRADHVFVKYGPYFNKGKWKKGNGLFTFWTLELGRKLDFSCERLMISGKSIMTIGICAHSVYVRFLTLKHSRAPIFSWYFDHLVSDISAFRTSRNRFITSFITYQIAISRSQTFFNIFAHAKNTILSNIYRILASFFLRTFLEPPNYVIFSGWGLGPHYDMFYQSSPLALLRIVIVHPCCIIGTIFNITRLASTFVSTFECS